MKDILRHWYIAVPVILSFASVVCDFIFQPSAPLAIIIFIGVFVLSYLICSIINMVFVRVILWFKGMRVKNFISVNTYVGGYPNMNEWGDSVFAYWHEKDSCFYFYSGGPAFSEAYPLIIQGMKISAVDIKEVTILHVRGGVIKGTNNRIDELPYYIAKQDNKTEKTDETQDNSNKESGRNKKKEREPYPHERGEHWLIDFMWSNKGHLQHTLFWLDSCHSKEKAEQCATRLKCYYHDLSPRK